MCFERYFVAGGREGEGSDVKVVRGALSGVSRFERRRVGTIGQGEIVRKASKGV